MTAATQMVAPGAEIVTASGFCLHCDSKFYDKSVVRFVASELPGGYGYIEIRHLSPAQLKSLPTSTS